MYINDVTILGNLTKVPELKKTSNGNSFCIMCLITEREVKNKDTNEYQPKTKLHLVKCWGKLAENIVKYYKKGDIVCVKGFLEDEAWKDSSGVEQSITILMPHGNDFSSVQKLSLKKNQDESKVIQDFDNYLNRSGNKDSFKDASSVRFNL